MAMLILRLTHPQVMETICPRLQCFPTGHARTACDTSSSTCHVSMLITALQLLYIRCADSIRSNSIVSKQWLSVSLQRQYYRRGVTETQHCLIKKMVRSAGVGSAAIKSKRHCTIDAKLHRRRSGPYACFLPTQLQGTADARPWAIYIKFHLKVETGEMRYLNEQSTV